jgi:beta-galactosidase
MSGPFIGPDGRAARTPSARTPWPENQIMKSILFLLSLLSAVTLTPAVRAAQPMPPPRQHLRFDAGWRFHRGDVPGAERVGFAGNQWRKVNLPHDWSIEDLPTVKTASTLTLATVPGQWRFQLGDDPAWKAPGFDDSAWQTVQLPTHWSTHVPGDITQKFGWYRRRIDVPAALRGKDILLLLGKVDDADETFVNGVKVGGEGGFPPNYGTAWTSTRRYLVPARLLKGDGTDVVAVRDYNGDGDAGIYQAATPMIQIGPFASDSPSGSAQGYMLGGIGWYRKTFPLAAGLRGHRLSITFDGVYMNSEVWFNGQLLGTHPYGYTGFSFDLTPYAHFGGANVLAVKADASGRTSRWYSGAGIYRHVWLTETNPVHIGQWGVSVTTPHVSALEATVRVQTTVDGRGEGQGLTLTSRVVDGSGKVVAATSASGPFAAVVAPLGQELTVTHPHLWSPDTPTLYHLVSTITEDGKVIDQTQTPFGIRSISFDAVHGFRLNGQPLKLRGGCVHHDNGPLGSRTYDRAEVRRVQLLKAAGFNAIRTSHNPPSSAFLDACDKLGMIVMDEAFDCWKYGKNPDDYGRFFDQWWKRDIDAMVQRDRNHPSIVLWSIGNEIPEQNGSEGGPRGAMLADEVRAQDPTRFVAQATNPDGDKLEPLLEHLDVVGYNYQAGRFASDHAKHPERVFAQTESFPTDCFRSWRQTADHPYVVGDFVWTAFDYLGEAGIGRDIYPGDSGDFGGDFPYAVSGCGDLDLTGQRKPQSYYRGIVWGVGPPVAVFVDAVVEGDPGYKVSGWGWPDDRANWTWPGSEGKNRTVRVYARTPKVRLLLNGQDLGEKETTLATQYTAIYTIPYAPGTLVAVGLDADDKEVSRWALRTAGAPAAIRLVPEQHMIKADGEDLAYVSVELRDAQGRLDPNATNLVHFTLTGPGKIVAVGSADPRSTESFQMPQRRAFGGRCLVIVQASEQAGTLRLTARAAGLKSAVTVITTKLVP